jgi:hypothetical protein
LINTQKTILTERRNSGSIPPRGWRLLGFLEPSNMQYAKGLGCEYLYIEVVVSDKWIYDWYKRLGFVEYKNNGDRISMFKKLNW